MIQIDRLDYLVLTVTDISASVELYEKALGMTAVTFGDGRTALTFGDSAINLHEHGQEISPHTSAPTPGSADLSFIVAGDLFGVADRLRELDVPVELGPVARSGALGPIQSVYVRDPDSNLIELSCYPVVAESLNSA